MSDAAGGHPEAGSDLADLADTDRPLWALLAREGREDAHWLGLGVVGAVIASVLDRADVFVIGLAIDALFNDRPFALWLVPDAWIPADQTSLLVFIVALLVAMKLGDIAAAAAGNVGAGIFSQRVLHRVRVGAFDDVQRQELAFFDEYETGEVMSALNNDVNTLERFLERGLGFAVRVSTSFVTVVVLLLVLNWQLAVFAVLMVPVAAAVNWWFSAVRERLQDVVRSETGSLNARVETNLDGVDVVKAYAAEPYESDRVAAASDDHRAARWSARRIAARHPPSMRLVTGITLVATFVVGAFWVVEGPPLFFSGELTAGQLVPFLIYTQSLTGPMRWLADLIGWHKQAKAAAKRIVGVQTAERTVDDDGVELVDPEGRVVFDDVRFGYPGTGEVVLDGVTFAVEPGETVGVVGTTGAGKSTLVKLLLRYYDVSEPAGSDGWSDERSESDGVSEPAGSDGWSDERSESDGSDGGSVRVDGRDVREYSRSSLRRSIGYVGQDPFLFDGSIRENVAYGSRPGDDVPVDGLDDDGDVHPAVERAIAEAGAEEFVSRLAEGYDTEVGERGVRLSGGQRQRIAIARALVSDPPILVFDEATSHVDNETELVIQRNLSELTRDRTTFVIAHRLSTVRDADRILVLDGGRVVESGTHEELLERDGAYATLWNVQVGNVAALPDSFLAEVSAGEGDD